MEMHRFCCDSVGVTGAGAQMSQAAMLLNRFDC